MKWLNYEQFLKYIGKKQIFVVIDDEACLLNYNY